MYSLFLLFLPKYCFFLFFSEIYIIFAEKLKELVYGGKINLAKSA